MVKEGYKGICIQLPPSLANTAPKLLKGKVSKICQKALELALGVNGELVRARQELQEAKERVAFLDHYVKQLEKEKQNEPKKYRTIC